MNILKALLSEQNQLEQQLATVRSAIAVYSGKKGKRRRRMSKAARAKIAQAQKLRWSKLKKKD